MFFAVDNTNIEKISGQLFPLRNWAGPRPKPRIPLNPVETMYYHTYNVFVGNAAISHGHVVVRDLDEGGITPEMSDQGNIVQSDRPPRSNGYLIASDTLGDMAVARASFIAQEIQETESDELGSGHEGAAVPVGLGHLSPAAVESMIDVELPAGELVGV